MSPERRWWSNVVRVLVRPRAVFGEIRSLEPADLDARQEPVLLIVLLAGIAGVLASPTAGRLLDDSDYDGLLVAVWAFIAGGIYGAFVYLGGGVVVHLGVRCMEGTGPWRLARHTLAFACVPLALSLLVVEPIALLAFGGDLFRSGGGDSGMGGDLVVALRVAFAAWSAALLVVGVRVVYRFAWLRVVGVLLLAGVFLAALIVLPSVL